MPSGESLIRQFLFGQRYFETKFGKRCETSFLPDSFGMSGALPQLMRGAGVLQSWIIICHFLFASQEWNIFLQQNYHGTLLSSFLSWYIVNVSPSGIICLFSHCIQWYLSLTFNFYSNVFPHTSFNWVGIDGTQVLSHLSPSKGGHIM